jgi:phosphoglycolate phosphatase
MTSLPVDAVLFDLDGTLLHTSLDISAAANAALAECALPAIADRVVESFIGRGIEALVKRCFAHLGLAQEGAGFEAFHAAFMRHYERLNGRVATAYPGVIAGLEAMRAAGLKLGVCTNKSAAFTRPLLERTGLAGYFSVVVNGDTLPRKKPEPDMLLHAAAQWGVAPARMLMIGDSRNDAAAARAAGCPVWLVPYGYNEGEPVEALDCDGFVSGLDDAARRIFAGVTRG